MGARGEGSVVGDLGGVVGGVMSRREKWAREGALWVNASWVKSIAIEPGSSRTDCHRSGIPMKSMRRRGCNHPFLLPPPLPNAKEKVVSRTCAATSPRSLDVTVLVIGVLN